MLLRAGATAPPAIAQMLRFLTETCRAPNGAQRAAGVAAEMWPLAAAQAGSGGGAGAGNHIPRMNPTHSPLRHKPWNGIPTTLSLYNPKTLIPHCNLLKLRTYNLEHRALTPKRPEPSKP